MPAPLISIEVLPGAVQVLKDNDTALQVALSPKEAALIFTIQPYEDTPAVRAVAHYAAQVTDQGVADSINRIYEQIRGWGDNISLTLIANDPNDAIVATIKSLLQQNIHILEQLTFRNIRNVPLSQFINDLQVQKSPNFGINEKGQISNLPDPRPIEKPAYRLDELVASFRGYLKKCIEPNLNPIDSPTQSSGLSKTN